jgi:hypothetical protein
VRFLVDAQLPPQLTQALRDLGHDSEQVSELGLTTATDIEVWHDGEPQAQADEEPPVRLPPMQAVEGKRLSHGACRRGALFRS